VSSLYIIEQGASLKKEGLEIIVEKDSKVLSAIETHRLDSILLFGNIQVTTQALRLLLEEGIQLAFLRQSGYLYGIVTPPISKNVVLRLEQYRAVQDPLTRLILSKVLVTAKLKNTLETLRQYLWNSPKPKLKDAAVSIQEMICSIQKSPTLSAISGIEGMAARTYFEAYATVFKEASIFHSRSKRPPLDPGNALLSLGYTLLAFRIQSHLNASGFDPYLGFYHRIDYGRPALSLDMLEPFRAPVVDRFVTRMFNLGVIKNDDFTSSPEEGYRLTPTALKRFFSHWEEQLSHTGFLENLNCQVDSLRAYLMKKEPALKLYQFKAR
jgi:CRISPR-associated protein Cas1